MYIIRKIYQNIIENEIGGVILMTTKELLYVEDALNQAKYFQTKCKETTAQINDSELKSCVEQIAQKQQQIFQNFYSLL